MGDTAAIYLRVSTDEQADPTKTSLSQQRERCLAYCQSQGWEIFEVYEDAGVSGTLEFRPAMQQLMKDAEEKRFSHVVFLKIDRLARNLRNLLNLAHQLKSWGVGLVSVEEHFDTGSAQGKLFFDLLGAFAEFEAAQINERMSNGRKGAVVKKGKYLASTVPFGYVKTADGKLKPHPEQAKVVKKMFQWARQGLGVKAIVTKLTEQGVEPPNQKSSWGWHFSTVYKILTAPRYIGKSTYGGLPMSCPPLVDEDTFNVVQATLKKHKRDSPRNTKQLYLLQHLIWCGHCGSRYMAKSTWNKQGPRPVYLCRQRTVYGKQAGHEGIRWRWDGKQLEDVIKRHVLKVIADPDYLVHDVKVYQAEAEQRLSEHRDQEKRLQAKLVDLEQQEIRALQGWQRGIYRDEQQVQETLAGLRAQQEETRAKLETLSQQAVIEPLTKAEKVRLLADQVVLSFAYEGGSGLFRRMEAGKTRESWLNKALADLEQREVVSVVVPGNDDQEWPVEQVPVAQWWRDLITILVDRITVNDDGSLNIEGTVQVASGRVSHVPRSR